MKIRKGFVSNSSSSSFVMYGFTITEKELNRVYPDRDYFYDEEDFDTVNADGRYGVGKLLAESDGDSGYLDDFEFNPYNAESIKIQNALKKFNKTEKNLRIFGGTYSS